MIVCVCLCVRACACVQDGRFSSFPDALNASACINMVVRLAKSQIGGDVLLCCLSAMCFLSKMAKKKGASRTIGTHLMQSTCDEGLFFFFVFFFKALMP